MATEYATADDFLTAPEGDPGEDYTLPSGRTVRVRGLSRFELMSFSKDSPNNADYEQRVIAACLIAPAMTRAKVEAWQKRDTAGGDLSALSEYIRGLSGLAEGAQKSAVAEVRD